MLTVAMTDAADRYRHLARRFTSVVDEVPEDAWETSSPCEGWTVRQVVDHVVESQHGFLARFGVEPTFDGEDDVRARWHLVRDAVQAGLDDPATAQTEYGGMFGPTTFAATVDDFLSADLLVHGWDIARAAGLAQHEPMPAEEVEELDARLRPMGDTLRMPGAFGPEVPVPGDAPAQDRLLGFLGRQP